MVKFRKLAAILLSAVMAVSALGVSASAASAKAINSGKSYSTTLKKSGSAADYKITSSRAGIMTIKLNTRMYQTLVYVYDSNNRLIENASMEATSGETHWDNNDKYISCVWNAQTGKYAGTLKFNIKKGTYRIRFERFSLQSFNDKGKGKLSFNVSLPSASTPQITGISIPMNAGSTIQLATTATAKIGSGKVKWSSSNSSVASVGSKGLVTAKRKGTAVITAKYGATKASVTITVS